MPDGLSRVLEDSYDGAFTRIAASHFGDELVLEIWKVQDDETSHESRWRIRARGVREYRLEEAAGDLEVFEADHFVLRQYLEPRRALGFRGQPPSPAETVGRLWLIHRDIAGEWVPFERYLNVCAGLEDLLAGGYGLLAEGPESLVRAYANVLSEQEVSTNLLSPTPANWWNGTNWVESTAPLTGISIGRSLIVAEDFEVEKID
ncbi:MAG: hypothetical protein RL885_18870 [Planctomycetota bacterium]